MQISKAVTERAADGDGLDQQTVSQDRLMLQGNT
jgi:hypothetical protein